MTVYDDNEQPIEKGEAVRRALERGTFATQTEAEAAWDRMIVELNRMFDQAKRGEGKPADEVFDRLIAKYEAMAAKRAA